MAKALFINLSLVQLLLKQALLRRQPGENFVQRQVRSKFFVLCGALYDILPPSTIKPKHAAIASCRISPKAWRFV